MVQKNRKIKYIPPIAIPPGETLLEILAERTMTQVELATRMHRPIKFVNEIIKGKTAILPETAIQLERVLGVPAKFWNNLESNFQETKARLKNEAKLSSEIKIAKKYPYKEMEKWRWIPKINSSMELVKNLLSFFAVTSLDNIIEKQAIELNYRISTKTKYDWPAIITWLRKGTIDGRSIKTETFNGRKLKKSLYDIRQFTFEDPELFVPKLKKILSDCGVSFTITPSLRNAPVNGASRWIGLNKALVQLSIRHKFADIFWFSFFHEVGHILLHNKKNTNIDLDQSILNKKKEEQANKFASDFLIPKISYKRFIEKNEFSQNSIRMLAKEINIHPGIVVGRLQHDGHVPHRYNKQRIRYEWIKPN